AINNQTHDSVSVRTLDGILTYWNQGAVDLYGWTSEEACGRVACEMLRLGGAVPPMSADDFIAVGSWDGEVEPFSKDGRQLVVQLRCSLLLDDRGRPAGVLSTGNDITQRKRADMELRRSEARYRNIFQTTSVSIWECDFSAVRARIGELAAMGMTDLRQYLRDHPRFVREAIDLTRAIAVNDASVSMFGAATKQDLIGSVGHIWPTESEVTFAEAMIAAFEGRPSYETETRLRRLDGRPVDLLFTTSFPPEAASRDSVFISVADITAHNEARAALLEAQTDLAHAMRLTSLGQLTASIAHEVNQPLGGIISNGQAGLRWLKREKPDIEAAARSLEGLIQEARRAGEVINRFRSLAKNDAPMIEDVDFNSLVEETILLLGHELRRANIETGTNLTRNLATIRGDRIQLQQVVINLVMNAVQAMATEEAVERELTVETGQSNDSIVVAVSDTGPGIAEEIKGRLFTAFATTKPDGMGMGLSVCGSIIHRHGGKIRVAENVGKGARFEFSLPIGGHEK
ncbi:PAS domain-containing sensor histidine kinase, partial [Sphingobium amiense]